MQRFLMRTTKTDQYARMRRRIGVVVVRTRREVCFPRCGSIVIEIYITFERTNGARTLSSCIIRCANSKCLAANSKCLAQSEYPCIKTFFFFFFFLLFFLLKHDPIRYTIHLTVRGHQKTGANPALYSTI